MVVSFGWVFARRAVMAAERDALRAEVPRLKLEASRHRRCADCESGLAAVLDV